MMIKNEMLRSGLVSLVTTALDLLLFLVCLHLVVAGSALVLARWICGAVGASANLLLNRRWVFGAAGDKLAGQALRYAIMAVGSVTLATLVWFGLNKFTALDPRILHPISLFVVWPLFTFPMLRIWVFAQRNERLTS